MSQKTLRYTSDMTDKQWEIIKLLLPLKHPGPRRPIELDMRQVVNAIFYVARTGCQWQNLPTDYPNYNSVYYHHCKWCKDGTWREIAVPTLVIGARHDTMDPAHMEMMAGEVQKGRYLFCPNGSHMVMYDDQKVYVDGVIRFIRDVDAGRF